MWRRDASVVGYWVDELVPFGKASILIKSPMGGLTVISPLIVYLQASTCFLNSKVKTKHQTIKEKGKDGDNISKG